jgi:hypothetical protein
MLPNLGSEKSLSGMAGEQFVPPPCVQPHLPLLLPLLPLTLPPLPPLLLTLPSPHMQSQLPLPQLLLQPLLLQLQYHLAKELLPGAFPE